MLCFWGVCVCSGACYYLILLYHTLVHPPSPLNKTKKGGGAALLHLSELVPAFRETLTNEEEKLGADIVMKALRAPARIIAHNAGVEGEVIVQRLLGTPFEVGYNAMTDTIEDLLAAGVIDPAKVTRNGLQNSCSIAGIMLSTQAVMVEQTRPGEAPGGYNPQGMPAGLTI